MVPSPSWSRAGCRLPSHAGCELSSPEVRVDGAPPYLPSIPCCPNWTRPLSSLLTECALLTPRPQRANCWPGGRGDTWTHRPPPTWLLSWRGAGCSVLPSEAFPVHLHSAWSWGLCHTAVPGPGPRPQAPQKPFEAPGARWGEGHPGLGSEASSPCRRCSPVSLPWSF